MKLRSQKTALSAVISVLLMFSLTFASVCTESETTGVAPIPEPSCEAALVVELNTGTVIYEKNADTAMYPASTTKMMTALLAVEFIESGRGTVDDLITFSRDAVRGIDAGAANIGIAAGEKLSVLQVLYAMMLPSANEACLGMAEYISGSVAEFVDRMNERAQELGMTGTNFMTTNGLHDDNHYSTARDLAVLLGEAVGHTLLREIMSAASYEIPATNKLNETRYLLNTNKLIVPAGGYYNPKVVCGKTGYTTPAGNVLATYSEVDGMGVITVLIKADQGTIFAETSALVDYCGENYRLVTVDNILDYSRSIPSEDASAQIMTAPAGSFGILAQNGDDESAYIKNYELPAKISAPQSKGDKIGTLTIYNGEKPVGSVDMVLLADYDPDAQTETGTGASDGETTAEETTTAGERHRGSSFIKLAGKFLLIILIAILIFAAVYIGIILASIMSYNKKRRKKAGLPAKPRDTGGIHSPAEDASDRKTLKK